MLLAMHDLFQEQRIMFLWDHKDSWRKKLYPAYKANRQADPERVKERTEVYRQIGLFREVLSAVGITQVEEQGLEADDIAGIISTRCHLSDRPLTMVSSDKDWYQLLTSSNRIVKGWTGKKLEEFHAEDVLKKFGVTIENWPKYQALLGESGDNIPKVCRGMGPVTACKVLAGVLPLPPEYQVQYELNLKLTTLRREGKLTHKWPEQSKEGWKFLEGILTDYELSDLWVSRAKLWQLGKWGRSRA